MKSRFLKSFFVIGLIVFAMPLMAENAKVTYIKGKVEISKNNTWVPLSVGDEVRTSETISTGFQSEAKLEYKGSIMSLGAVTRITLEKLSESDSKDDVSVYLKTGAVRSKVNHADSKKVSYVVKTPVAVASVRGTDFMVTANGHVSCFEGAVAVYANTENRNRNNNTSVVEEEPEEDSETEETTEAGADSGSAVSTEASGAAETSASSETSSSSTAASESTSSARDNGPARSTTPAREIDTSAPAGAVVVGRNQSVVMKVTGNPETPVANAIKKTTSVKDTVSTAASQEAVSIGGSGTIAKTMETETVAEPVVKPVTSLVVEIQFE